MARRKKPLLEAVEISAVTSEGKGLARCDGKVIFIERGVPGDEADVRITGKKKGVEQGFIQTLLKPSTDRQEPFCDHARDCGGCKWQHISYEAQLKFKEQMVVDSFERIGKISPKEMLPIAGAEKTTLFRNKLEYSFSDKSWLPNIELGKEQKPGPALGFHVPRFFDKVVDINHCHLQDERTNTIRNAFKAFALETGYGFYNARKHTGFFRNLVIRNTSLDQWLIMLIVGEQDQDKIHHCMSFFKEQFPWIQSNWYLINQKKNDSYYDLKPVLFRGKAFIEEKLAGLKFKIGPTSFFQTNTYQAERLYAYVSEFSGLKEDDVVYDLYTGVGSIGLSLARKCKTVIGIEHIEGAIEDAKLNAKLNRIKNAHFYAGDVREQLMRIVDEHGRPDLLVTDPPRSGMHPDALKDLLELSPERIVYVSCNPATQARDVAVLSEKYELKKLVPVDMFPHTAHIETVALLKIKE